MKTISNKPSHLQINCIRTMMTTHEDSDDDVFGPILKSKGSRCSTIDSPTIYARKTAFYSTESQEEEEVCQDYLERGTCRYGDQCQSPHRPNKMKKSNQRIFENYPEVISESPTKRIRSFLH